MATSQTNLSAFEAKDVPSGKGLKIALVVAEWNAQITNKLCLGARTTLIDCGVNEKDIHITYVPGSFELVFGARKALEKQVDAVIVIGSVIQGQTKHFDFVCQGVTQGIVSLNLSSDQPVVFCVLTDNSLQQSIDRSGGVHGNKGVEAAVTAIKMAHLAKQ
ncbi:6,7-dimethyl-8-ribityllumazine synthase [Flavobacteriaceae bacterium]|jgi:6,7-dimethyl-8-ribityllumazine synthase|nr:6,7-dimethyl-8-ribityllumazine synthase [Flavobacteriaceae bacterium]